MNEKKEYENIDIHDRVMEAYYGKLGETLMWETQHRIHWICNSVNGNIILDVGCSQGILPLLLGREGKNVKGLDISQKAIDEANASLEQEEFDVQENVEFLRSNFMIHDFEGEKYDTIIIAEVLEHLVNPQDFVSKASTLLKEDGKIIITVPFGINDFIDHKKTYYLHDMYEMINQHFYIDNISILGQWIGFVALKKGIKTNTDKLINLQLLKDSEEAFYVLERGLTTKLEEKTAFLLDANTKYKEVYEKYKELYEKYKGLIQVEKEKTNTIKMLQTKLNSANNNFNSCQSSASYKLGHLLIHETKSFSDIMKFIPRLNNIRKSKKVINNVNQISVSNKKVNQNIEMKLQNGVSVIIPTYNGHETIERTLSSLKEQILENTKYEIIIVLNGEDKGTGEIVSNYKNINNHINIKLIKLDEKGVSIARNRGIKEAKYSHIALIDDDDVVSPNYLNSMLEIADETSIIVSQIVNLDAQTINASNAMNMQVLNATVKDNFFIKVPSILSISGCKLIPTKYAKQIVFDESLKSGEDVVFFTELYSSFPCNFKAVKEAQYFRYITDISVSRQPLTYKFNVEERLNVVYKLLNILGSVQTRELSRWIKQNIASQINFINVYLQEFPSDYNKIVKKIKTDKVYSFPFQQLYSSDTKTSKMLVISYCFTPFVDTSAIVMAKRIEELAISTDVVFNNMSSVRNTNESLQVIASDYINTRMMVESTTSFSQWKSIEEFSEGVNFELSMLPNTYEIVYSRVMWPASNFAAFEYKLKNPQVNWKVEFSDPILYDIKAKVRYSKITSKWHFATIEEVLNRRSISMPKSDNMFFWCEYIAYIFADELIFTNQNQLLYMTQSLEGVIKEIVLSKSKVIEQPTLSRGFYEKEKYLYPLDKSLVNIAYFGSFYETRKLNDILAVIKALSSDLSSKVKFHIFTNTKDTLIKQIELESLGSYFIVNDYIGYFEFLNLTTQVDCLLLEDAVTKPQKDLNPYLPSKLSDYMGSASKIWALYEEGSILSQHEKIDYKSKLGDIENSCKVITKLIQDLNK